MAWLHIVAIIYGVLNIAFGLLGYFSGSLVSLIAGGAAGLAAIFGATLAKTHQKVGFVIVLVVSVAILGRFFKAAFIDFKVYPALILALASVLMIVCLAVGHVQSRLAPKGESDKPSQ